MQRFWCAAVVSAVLAGGLVLSAEGYPPETTIVRVDGTFVNDFDCAFPLLEEVSGTVRDTLFFDNDGALTREFISPQFQGAVRVTWTNPLTGTSLSSHEATALFIDWASNGSFASLANPGLTFKVSVPGSGLLLIDAGRIEITRGLGITAMSGPHQELNGDTGAFCAYLAQ